MKQGFSLIYLHYHQIAFIFMDGSQFCSLVVSIQQDSHNKTGCFWQAQSCTSLVGLSQLYYHCVQPTIQPSVHPETYLVSPYSTSNVKMTSNMKTTSNRKTTSNMKTTSNIKTISNMKTTSNIKMTSNMKTTSNRKTTSNMKMTSI